MARIDTIRWWQATSNFTLYVVEIERGKERWLVERRYSKLVDLHRASEKAGASHGTVSNDRPLIWNSDLNLTEWSRPWFKSDTGNETEIQVESET